MNEPGYEEWKPNNQCKINHTGSANSMETVGAVRILNGPMLNGDLNTRTCHAREDDSATYSSIVDSKPYGDECVSKKLEFQKRVGSRLRKLKSAKKAHS